MESLSRAARHGALVSKQLNRPGPRPRSPYLLTCRSQRPTRSFRTTFIANSDQLSFSRRRPTTYKHPFPNRGLQQRLLSTKPLPSHRGPVVRFLYRTFAYTGLFIVASGALVVAFFAYDASTYREPDKLSDIPVSEAALSPTRGGPKNLPIADVLIDDEDCPEMAAQSEKPRLVILGTGWGSVPLLKALNPGDYHVTVVSPVNYFLFTPLMPSAAVGTLEFRSLVEPVRRIINRVRGHFLKAEAVGVEFSEKLVEIAQVDAQGNKEHFYLPYDKLVIGVGE